MAKAQIFGSDDNHRAVKLETKIPYHLNLFESYLFL